MNRVPLPEIGAVGASPLAGGVSGAAVWRAKLNGRTVVIKRTEPLEPIALRLLADAREPLIPSVIMSGEDDHGPWIVLPFHSGPPAGIVGEIPIEVYRYLGRLHARFLHRPLPVEFERLSGPFVDRMLTDFAPAALHAARELIGRSLQVRSTDLLRRLAADPDFRGAHRLFEPTLLHGDLYGMNVMLSGPAEPHPLIIDWNSTRVGPAMFDVAMSVGYDSEQRAAHDDGWAGVLGRRPNQRHDRVSHAWSATLINIGYAGVVALRHSAAEAEKMIVTAEEEHRRFGEFLGAW